MQLVIDERPDRIDLLTRWLPRIALAIVFCSVGWQKFAAHSMWVRIFDQIGLGIWFRYATGAIQLAGGVLVLVPRAAAAGFVLLGCTMAGAVAAWLTVLHAPSNAVIPGVLLVAVIVVGWSDMSALVARARRRAA